ncbi:MAG TPA: RidA family protein [Chloroflexota bacterium]|nr:RidA family protein [Chloroflexota bacterium]
MRIEQRLAELGLELPEPPRPVANYVSWTQADNILFLGGVSNRWNGELRYVGKVGGQITPEDGYQAARLCALNHIAILKTALGNLDRVKRILKMVGYINAAPGFNQLPKVLNGASDLLVEVFGDAGRHARLAIGVAELNADIPVETELTVLVE